MPHSIRRSPLHSKMFRKLKWVRRAAYAARRLGTEKDTGDRGIRRPFIIGLLLLLLRYIF